MELGARPTASDLTAVAVDQLRRRHSGLEVVKMDVTAERCAVRDRSFDFVSAMDVLFHILDDSAYRRAIGNLRALVTPGGYLILTENRVRRAEQRGDRQVSRTAETIDRLLGEAGFTVVSRRPMFVLMNTPLNSGSRVLRLWWQLIMTLATRWPRLGGILGALVYPVERVLLRFVSEGPSTELLVCRARATSGSAPTAG
jgi:hypothetical protein